MKNVNWNVKNKVEPISLSEKINNLSNLEDVLYDIGYIKRYTNNKRISYYNVACAFDIETSSFYDNGKKVGIMYLWSFSINGRNFIGRDWKSALNLFDRLREYYNLNESNRLLVYVHNLAFEFQFMRKLINWLSVFSVDSRTPVKALSEYGIEFRCSYVLSGYSLFKLSDQLVKYKVEKLIGDLDYSLIRNSKTKLTNKELMYSIHDVLVVVAYIQETIEHCGNITKIPLTKTGFVRNLCRENCLYKTDSIKDNKKYHNYRNIIKSNKLDEDKYLQLKRVFAGGFTHSNAIHTDTIINNVGSFDETSAYPTKMCAELFPTGTSETIELKSLSDLESKLNIYCCIFEAEFYDIKATVLFENYISKSKCRKLEDYVENNGRIVEAKHLIITLTEIDFKIIYMWYKWEDLKIYNFRIYKKNYLPTDFVKTILDLYNKKTMLKGVVEKELEYLKSKENINSTFGMAVTDIVQELVTYENNMWGKEKPDINKALAKYNNSPKRFLCYEWGVWTTAYNRYTLCNMINEFKYDHVYCDTDSEKGINYNNHLEYIKKDNDRIINQLKNAMKYHQLDFDLTRPKNIRGETKQLGIWEFEGEYKRFKTLGAKRYMIEENNALLIDLRGYTGVIPKDSHIINKNGIDYMSLNYNLTVSGVNKAYAIPYLIDKYNDPFSAFNDGLHIPAEYSGKLTHTYIDDEQKGYIIDYQGNKSKYCELSSIHLESAEYNASLADAYVEYLMRITLLKSNKLD